ncbi:hypothetical protein [Caulobacter sp. BE264]|nr:hypothetical protein [Caulobacter sp. BE264]
MIDAFVLARFYYRPLP